MHAFARSALAATLLGTLVTGQAHAMVPAASLQADIQSSLSSSGNVNATFSNGIVTLTGYADSASSAAAVRTARAGEGVVSVINLIRTDG